jgi:hypothetical protein
MIQKRAKKDRNKCFGQFLYFAAGFGATSNFFLISGKISSAGGETISASFLKT